MTYRDVQCMETVTKRTRSPCYIYMTDGLVQCFSALIPEAPYSAHFNISLALTYPPQLSEGSNELISWIRCGTQ